MKPLCAGIFAGYAEFMTPPTHLSAIRELREIRNERPRFAGETEDHYFQRVATELRRRQHAQRGGLVRRVLRREARR